MNIDTKSRVIHLIQELLETDTTEERDVEIAIELKSIVPDPYCMDYIFQSDEFVNSDGSFNYEGLIKKCFDDYEPSIIAL
ncbi:MULTISPECIES: hypothetical protein [unclassified Pseudodesulfovibrio]|uniref:hypothetical protein n=1 Tax=unclassified Pseudodesulfovibrio TaxID=2661612 RepID=UPI000FEBBB28|nr:MULTISPECIES: hypothetical protein [unclassified Pseudodesulfovibrio]MCJ2163632.1 hypothetical protein [Pseudodesulfovibrio sp. S3-i]RWU06861.1 hypothetical protein DWB63_03640 [Pseudodesulfovibrio sp. S3]